MTDRHHYFAFRARYFPTFLGSMLLITFSMALATSQVFYTWFNEAQDGTIFQVMVLIGAAMVLALGGLLVTRGRREGFWVLVAMPIVSLLAVLPTFPGYGSGIELFIYALGLLLPLLGLLMLNSQRQREMRADFIALRIEREQAGAEAGRQQALEKNREKLRKNKARGR
ncbi:MULTISPECIES: hypothetical protein [Pseudomonas syringae group]|uniref:Uncharacterized protein n=2 Tax=Pseudomonas syringae group TaxID=136849 RepID=A0ABX6H6M4_9PSED|nr:hypothetical protein [Pseudomonas asturiensis]QHF01171.1 hypothetical protein N015_01625 [Pseudomonas asturiensis]